MSRVYQGRAGARAGGVRAQAAVGGLEAADAGAAAAGVPRLVSELRAGRPQREAAVPPLAVRAARAAALAPLLLSLRSGSSSGRLGGRGRRRGAAVLAAEAEAVVAVLLGEVQELSLIHI